MYNLGLGVHLSVACEKLCMLAVKVDKIKDVRVVYQVS